MNSITESEHKQYKCDTPRTDAEQEAWEWARELGLADDIPDDIADAINDRPLSELL